MRSLLELQLLHVRIKLHLLHNLGIAACKSLDFGIRECRFVHVLGNSNG